MTTVETNKAFVHDYLNALSGKPKPRQIVARFVSDPNLMQHIEQVELAFPSYSLTVRQMLAENDWVVVRATFNGVHGGNFAGIAPSGRDVEAGAVMLYRVQDRRIVECHLQFDLAGV